MSLTKIALKAEIAALKKANQRLRGLLAAIHDYGRDGPRSTEDGYPEEIVYDEFAYKRIVDTYREAAEVGGE